MNNNNNNNNHTHNNNNYYYNINNNKIIIIGETGSVTEEERKNRGQVTMPASPLTSGSKKKAPSPFTISIAGLTMIAVVHTYQG